MAEPSHPFSDTHAAARGAGRVVGLDLGERRIGVAVSDSRRVLASPYAVIVRSGDAMSDRARISALVRELEAVLLVIGLPLSLDGSKGKAAHAALEEAAALSELLALPVVTSDERLTTVEAQRRRTETRAQTRGEGGAGRSGPRRRQAPGRRAVIDDAAATIILQSFLDGGGGHDA